MSPAAARTTARRLVGVVVVLTSATPLAAAAGAVALDGPAGPLWWAVPLLAAFAGALGAAVLALVRGTSPDPPAAALVAVGAVTTLSQAALLSAGLVQTDPAPTRGAWSAYVLAASVQASAVLARNAPRGWGVALPTASSALVAATAPPPPPLPQQDVTAQVLYGTVLALIAASMYYLARGLEQTTGRVGAVRGAALRADAEAEALALAEAERGRWEAAVHDDVLTALRAGAAARTDEEVRAASAAASAALRSIAAEPTTLTVGTALAAQQVGAAARGAFDAAVVDVTSEPGSLPGRVVEALADATAELMRNTVHHNPAGVRARVHGHLHQERIRVVVSDDGGGFDADALPTGRLGIRVSVVGRMRSVGGEADVSSSRRGTTVELRWPR